MFPETNKPAEFIDSVRQVFRAYIPESDAWAKPNFLSIFSSVVGGMFWSAINEARNGIDKRMNPQTAEGVHLDNLASIPPLNLTRRSETQASGFVTVEYPGVNIIPSGYQFRAADGTKYEATNNIDLVDGMGLIPVRSVGYGSDQNSIENRPLEGAYGPAQSAGIFGGFDIENDDQLRRRMYAERSKCHFFGSACSYEDVMLGIRGVSRAWAVEDGAVAKILFLMEDSYRCGDPRPEDIENIQAIFEDECLSNMFFCPVFEGACTKTISPDIQWNNATNSDIELVEKSMEKWLRDNYGIGEGVSVYQMQCWLDGEFPEMGGKLTCLTDYPPDKCCVYNCVELIRC